MTSPAEGAAVNAPARGGKLGLVIGIVVLLAALLAFTALQYAMPDSFDGQWEVNRPGLRDFQRHWLNPPTLSLQTFVWLFRLCLIAAWAGYGLMLAFGFRCKRLAIPRALLISLVAGMALVVALVFPCSLSSDSYVYVTYGRLQVIYGLNPYAHQSDELHELGDPARGYQRSSSVAPYGPVWVQICIFLVWLFPRSELWFPVLGIKLVGGVALVACSFFARSIARHFSEDKADLTLLAVGLNPLFLLEGPGNGHNDFAMMAFLMGGVLASLKKNYNLASFLFGLSGGIKFFTWAVGLWVLMERARGVNIRGVIGHAFLTFFFLLAPAGLCYLPLSQGSQLSKTLAAHSMRGSETAMAQDLARSERLREWGCPEPLIRPALMLWRQWLVAGLYVAISVWIYVKPAPGRLLEAWTFLAVGLFFWTMGVLFPWYLSWFWMGPLTLWRRPTAYLVWMCFPLAVVLTLKYSLVWG
jgi:hypothetical protein